jgi:methionyl-tRNA formyltransferase
VRLAFAGTPPFAATALAALADAGHAIGLVLTQPDRPAGRGQKPQASAVKSLALERGLALAQPAGLRLDGRHGEAAAVVRAALERLAPDALVVAAYGLLLPPWLLALPRFGCLNLHASLLPRWRGAAPVQRAIEAGDTETGIVLMQMDEGLDTGAMRLVRRTPIDALDTAATLTERLAAIGGEVAVEGLAQLAAGTLPAVPQPAEGVTHAAKIAKQEATIDWCQPAAAIERRLRAFDPFPGARSVLLGEPLVCWRGRVIEGGPRGEPGARIGSGAGRLIVACGDGALELLVVQRPGGRRLEAADLLRREALPVDARFELPAAATI